VCVIACTISMAVLYREVNTTLRKSRRYTAAVGATDSLRRSGRDSNRVAIQAMLYSLTFVITWMPSTLWSIAHWFQWSHYALDIAAATAEPLQGFWNLLIFLRSRPSTVEKIRDNLARFLPCISPPTQRGEEDGTTGNSSSRYSMSTTLRGQLRMFVGISAFFSTRMDLGDLSDSSCENGKRKDAAMDENDDDNKHETTTTRKSVTWQDIQGLNLPALSESGSDISSIDEGEDDGKVEEKDVSQTEGTIQPNNVSQEESLNHDEQVAQDEGTSQQLANNEDMDLDDCSHSDDGSSHYEAGTNKTQQGVICGDSSSTASTHASTSTTCETKKGPLGTSSLPEIDTSYSTCSLGTSGEASLVNLEKNKDAPSAIISIGLTADTEREPVDTGAHNCHGCHGSKREEPKEYTV